MLQFISLTHFKLQVVDIYSGVISGGAGGAMAPPTFYAATPSFKFFRVRCVNLCRFWKNLIESQTHCSYINWIFAQSSIYYNRKYPLRGFLLAPPELSRGEKRGWGQASTSCIYVRCGSTRFSQIRNQWRYQKHYFTSFGDYQKMCFLTKFGGCCSKNKPATPLGSLKWSRAWQHHFSSYTHQTLWKVIFFKDV